MFEAVSSGLFDKRTKKSELDYQTLRESFPYRPTLFLGLGGTGSHSVNKIKELFEKLYAPVERKRQEGEVAKIPPMYVFRAFDTHAKDKPSRLRNGQEWFHCGVDDLQAFYQHQGGTKFFRDWLLQNYPMTNLVAGAGGYRNLGRLALMYNIGNINRQLGKAKAQLEKSDERLVTTQPVVYVFCSASGGTGAGMLLDVSFVLRHLMPKVEIVAYVAVIDDFPTLDSDSRRHLRRNTYCALKELDAVMSGNADSLVGKGAGKLITYPGGVRAWVMERPLNQCYLLSQRRNDNTTSLPTHNHITSFMARHAFMACAYFTDVENETSSPDFQGLMDNNLKSTSEKFKGAGTSYLVPGMGQAHFPIEETADYFAMTAAINYIRYQCGGRQDLQGDAEARTFMQANSIDYLSLRTRLSKDPELLDDIYSGDSYDQQLSQLMTAKARYSHAEEILSFGEKMPYERLQEIVDYLSANVPTVEDSLWKVTDRMCKMYLVDPEQLARGTIDFFEDLRTLLDIEMKVVGAKIHEGKKELEQIESQWKTVGPIVRDVTTDDGAWDRLTDKLMLEKAKMQYNSFLTEAEDVVVTQARNELVDKLLTSIRSRVTTRLEELRSVFAEGKLLSVVRAILEQKRNEIATDLRIQSEGKKDTVEDVCSLNVMTQEWRDNYLKEHLEFNPENVLKGLKDTGYHPIQLLDLNVPDNVREAEYVAGAFFDEMVRYTQRERQLKPLDVLKEGNDYRGRKPEEIISSLYSKMMAQMHIASMKTRLTRDVQKVTVCGGIDSNIKADLEQSEGFTDSELHVSNNLETNRINFFSASLPIAIAGCDTVLNVHEPEYDEWIQEASKLKPTERLNELRKYHTFPGAEKWPRPTRIHAEVVKEKETFARALAISTMAEPSEADLVKMKEMGKGGKPPLYGIYQVGRSKVWLMPFFTPNESIGEYKERLDEGIRVSGFNRPQNLGSNVFKAYLRFTEEPKLQSDAENWVQWAENEWIQEHNNAEIESYKEKVDTLFKQRQAKTDDERQRELWEELREYVATWRLG